LNVNKSNRRIKSCIERYERNAKNKARKERKSKKI